MSKKDTKSNNKKDTLNEDPENENKDENKQSTSPNALNKMNERDKAAQKGHKCHRGKNNQMPGTDDEITSKMTPTIHSHSPDLFHPKDLDDETNQSAELFGRLSPHIQTNQISDKYDQMGLTDQTSQMVYELNQRNPTDQYGKLGLNGQTNPIPEQNKRMSQTCQSNQTPYKSGKISKDEETGLTHPISDISEHYDLMTQTGHNNQFGQMSPSQQMGLTGQTSRMTEQYDLMSQTGLGNQTAGPFGQVSPSQQMGLTGQTSRMIEQYDLMSQTGLGNQTTGQFGQVSPSQQMGLTGQNSRMIEQHDLMSPTDQYGHMISPYGQPGLTDQTNPYGQLGLTGQTSRIKEQNESLNQIGRLTDKHDIMSQQMGLTGQNSQMYNKFDHMGLTGQNSRMIEQHDIMTLGSLPTQTPNQFVRTNSQQNIKYDQMGMFNPTNRLPDQNDMSSNSPFGHMNLTRLNSQQTNKFDQLGLSGQNSQLDPKNPFYMMKPTDQFEKSKLNQSGPGIRANPNSYGQGGLFDIMSQTGYDYQYGTKNMENMSSDNKQEKLLPLDSRDTLDMGLNFKDKSQRPQASGQPLYSAPMLQYPSKQGFQPALHPQQYLGEYSVGSMPDASQHPYVSPYINSPNTLSTPTSQSAALPTASALNPPDQSLPPTPKPIPKSPVPKQVTLAKQPKNLQSIPEKKKSKSKNKTKKSKRAKKKKKRSRDNSEMLPQATNSKQLDYVSYFITLGGILILILALLIPKWGCGYLHQCFNDTNIKAETHLKVLVGVSYGLYGFTILLLLIFLMLFMCSIVSGFNLRRFRIRKQLSIASVIFLIAANICFGVAYKRIVYVYSLLTLMVFFLSMTILIRIWKEHQMYITRKRVQEQFAANESSEDDDDDDDDDESNDD